MDRHIHDGTLDPDSLARRIAKMAHQCGTYSAARWAVKQGIKPRFITRAILGRCE